MVVIEDTDHSENCGTLPDASQSIIMAPNSSGPLVAIESPQTLDLEDHVVTTKDGYNLTLQRVKMNPRYANARLTSTSTSGGADPVLLVHGLICQGSHWLLNKEEKCLPHVLMRNGYDCWIANLRGTELSKTHKILEKDNTQFWDFSFDEMVRFDLPAMMEYILSETRKEHLFYIGHSMGCLILFGTLSIFPEYNRRIKKAVALAPAVCGKNMNNFYLRVGAVLGFGVSRIRTFYSRQVMLDRSTLSSHISLCPFVGSYPVAADKIGGFLLSTLGVVFGMFGRGQIESARLQKISSNWPSTTSLKTILHMAQLYSGKGELPHFSAYDYGKSENLKEYSSEGTPTYDLRKTLVPIAIFSSESDQLSTPKDVMEVIQHLPRVEEHIQLPESQKFAHIDYLVGKDACELVYEKVVVILNETRSRRGSMEESISPSTSPPRISMMMNPEAEIHQYDYEVKICRNPDPIN